MNTPKDDLLSISKMASLRRVTVETLRYYDRIGLLTPDYVDPQSGYRYYSIRQYEKLGTIKELRDLGFSIHEIQDYFSDRNLSKSAAILSSHYASLQEKIRREQELSDILAGKLAFLTEIAKPVPEEVVTEREFPARRALTFGKKAGGPRIHALVFTRLEQYLKADAPILATDRVGVYGDRSLLKPSSSCIPCVPMILLTEKDKIEEHVITFPAGRYLCMDYRGGALEEYHPSFAQITDVLWKRNLHITGSILQIYRIDKTLTDQKEETLLELQVPVS